MDTKYWKKKNKNETKREKFVRIAERRVNKILSDFDSLGKCSNKKNYEYNDEDVKRMFQALEKKMKETKLLYQNSKPKKNLFSLEKDQ